MKVGEESARGIVEHADPGFLRYVFKAAIAAIAIKPVGQSCRLAYIEIIESVIVEVAHGHAVVAVNVRADCAVQNRAPMIDAAQHLLVIGCRSAKSLGSYINERRPVR